MRKSTGTPALFNNKRSKQKYTMALNHLIWEAVASRSISLMILHFFSICACLKDLKIYEPEAVSIGDAATLSCNYDLQNASLYLVRWYLKQEEFYRFVPKESPSSRVFAVAGINVDLKQSGEHRVTLKSVARIISGNYQCEVSADAPLFHTESNTSRMLVAELPAHNPVLSVSNMANDSIDEIGLGELLKATCVSSPSFPPVNFTWTINDKILPSSNVGLQKVDEKKAIVHGIDLESSANEAWSNIIVRIDSHENNQILIRCETNIFNLFRDAAEAQLKINNDYISIHRAKVSPTIDQRSSSTSFRGGDPDNSALQAGAIGLFSCSCSVVFLSQLFCSFVIPTTLLSKIIYFETVKLVLN